MEFTDEEVEKMVASFKALGVKPKADTPEDLRSWLAAMPLQGLCPLHLLSARPTHVIRPLWSLWSEVVVLLRWSKGD